MLFGTVASALATGLILLAVLLVRTRERLARVEGIAEALLEVLQQEAP